MRANLARGLVAQVRDDVILMVQREVDYGVELLSTLAGQQREEGAAAVKRLA